ncbi:FAD-binding oxidoreductase [Micromonospora sp. NPDC050397]|uniref:FAD-binding oxidoreductase n=1 Tax=Micromonospora sp. NPDC050397 TaxID=3364279 RepID=UPI00384D3586
MQSRQDALRSDAETGTASEALGDAASPAPGSRPGQWSALADRLQGDLVLPDDDGYELAKQLQYAEFDAVNPRAIAYCESASDVQECVRYARSRGIPIAVRSGGHAVLGWSTGPGLVIDLTRIKHATVSGDTVHIGPGLEAIDALVGLGAQGKQLITGTCPTVCPGGFLSGGGIGLQTRKFGVGSDRLVSASVVLADGSLVRASEQEEPDLFWALRGGGGGNFGVVVDFEVRPIEAPRMVFFHTVWPWEKAAEVLAAWQTWTLKASHDLGAQLMFMLPDAAPGNVPLVFVNGGYLGPKPELDAALEQLTALVGVGPTESFATDLSYLEAMRNIYGCAELTPEQSHRVGHNPDATLHRSGFLREQYRYTDRPFDAAELTALVSHFDADRQPGQLRALHCMSLGGVANQVGPTATAYVHRSAQFIVGLASEVVQPAPGLPEAVEAFAAGAAALLEPIASGAYVNFPGATVPDWQTAYYGQNYPRLVRVKRRYDPDNLFAHGRSIGQA